MDDNNLISLIHHIQVIALTLAPRVKIIIIENLFEFTIILIAFALFIRTFYIARLALTLSLFIHVNTITFLSATFSDMSAFCFSLDHFTVLQTLNYVEPFSKFCLNFELLALF